MNSEKRHHETLLANLNEQVRDLKEQKLDLQSQLERFRQASLNENENQELLEKRLREDIADLKKNLKTARDGKRKNEQEVL